MSVFRVDKHRDFTVIANHVFKDTKLSAKAKGILVEMLSLPTVALLSGDLWLANIVADRQKAIMRYIWKCFKFDYMRCSGAKIHNRAEHSACSALF